MDAISLAASIISLADAAFALVKYLEAVKQGGKARHALLEEITKLWMVLRRLQEQFDLESADLNDASFQPYLELVAPNGLFDQIRHELENLDRRCKTNTSAMGKLAQTLAWPFTQKQVAQMLERIQRLNQWVTIVLSASNNSLVQEILRDTRETNEIVRDSHFQAVTSWLSSLNFRQMQLDTIGTPGTGVPFLKGKAFRAWLRGPERILWCQGAPGAGKSVLASLTYDELRKTFKDEKATFLIAFCSFDNVDSQSPDHILRSLLKQLLYDTKKIPPELAAVYNKIGSDGEKLPTSRTIEFMNAALAKFQKCYIILDGLDEMNDEYDRRSMVQHLQNLKHAPKIMITSRPLSAFDSFFGNEAQQNRCSQCNCDKVTEYLRCTGCQSFVLCQCCVDAKAKCELTGHSMEKQCVRIEVTVRAELEDLTIYVEARIALNADLEEFIKQEQNLKELIIDSVLSRSERM
jgi:ankyrin repeat domain-containing protein 50